MGDWTRSKLTDALGALIGFEAAAWFVSQYFPAGNIFPLTSVFGASIFGAWLVSRNNDSMAAQPHSAAAQSQEPRIWI